LPDGTKTFGKTINNDPEKFYTPEVMKLLDDAASQEFKYGNKKIQEIEEEVEDVDTEAEV
jgi:tRNA(Phe) wybutosine-synthesizing methylase Tyw3